MKTGVEWNGKTEGANWLALSPGESLVAKVTVARTTQSDSARSTVTAELWLSGATVRSDHKVLTLVDMDDATEVLRVKPIERGSGASRQAWIKFVFSPRLGAQDEDESEHMTVLSWPLAVAAAALFVAAAIFGILRLAWIAANPAPTHGHEALHLFGETAIAVFSAQPIADLLLGLIRPNRHVPKPGWWVAASCVLVVAGVVVPMRTTILRNDSKTAIALVGGGEIPAGKEMALAGYVFPQSSAIHDLFDDKDNVLCVDDFLSPACASSPQRPDHFMILPGWPAVHEATVGCRTRTWPIDLALLAPSQRGLADPVLAGVERGEKSLNLSLDDKCKRTSSSSAWVDVGAATKRAPGLDVAQLNLPLDAKEPFEADSVSRLLSSHVQIVGKDESGDAPPPQIARVTFDGQGAPQEDRVFLQRAHIVAGSDASEHAWPAEDVQWTVGIAGEPAHDGRLTCAVNTSTVYLLFGRLGGVGAEWFAGDKSLSRWQGEPNARLLAACRTADHPSDLYVDKPFGRLHLPLELAPVHVVQRTAPKQVATCLFGKVGVIVEFTADRFRCSPDPPVGLKKNCCLVSGRPDPVPQCSQKTHTRPCDSGSTGDRVASAIEAKCEPSSAQWCPE